MYAASLHSLLAYITTSLGVYHAPYLRISLHPLAYIKPYPWVYTYIHHTLTSRISRSLLAYITHSTCVYHALYLRVLQHHLAYIPHTLPSRIPPIQHGRTAFPPHPGGPYPPPAPPDQRRPPVRSGTPLRARPASQEDDSAGFQAARA